MSAARTHALFVRELRGWRRRFWWLPALVALAVTLPTVLTQTTPRGDYQQRWDRYSSPQYSNGPETDDNEDFLRLPLRAEVMGWTLLATMGVGFLLAGWLARELRYAEVRNDTLGDLVLTTIQPGELFTAQLAAAWAIAAMPLVAALPVFLAFGVRTGHSPTELLTGTTLLLATPLLGACLGYATPWWKRLVLVSARDRAFRFWMLGFVLCAAALSWGLAALVTYPNRKWVEAALPKRWRSDAAYFDELLLGNFVLGLWLLAAAWVLVCLARALWRRGRVTRVLLFIAITLVAWRAVHWHPQAEIKQAMAGAQRESDSYWGLVSRLRWYDQLISVPFVLPMTLTSSYGGDLWAGWEREERWLGISGAIVFWLTFALAAALLGWFDVRWVLTQPWTIAAIQRPEVAPMMLELGGRGHRQRARNYVFDSRNPVWDFTLARSAGSRVVVFVWFGLVVVGTAVSLFRHWPRLRQAEPAFNPLREPVQLALALTAILCALLALNCGLAIAQLRATQQWWAFLSTPMRLRSILAGLCLPRLVDALVLLVSGGALTSVAFALNVKFWDCATHPFWYHAYETLAPMGVATEFTFVTWAVSIWAASRAKSPARTTLLTVIIVPIIALALPALWAWGLDRKDVAWRRFEPWGRELSPAPWHTPPWEYLTVAVPFVVPLLIATVLLWLGVRRLRWETR